LSGCNEVGASTKSFLEAFRIQESILQLRTTARKLVRLFKKFLESWSFRSSMFTSTSHTTFSIKKEQKLECGPPSLPAGSVWTTSGKLVRTSEFEHIVSDNLYVNKLQCVMPLVLYVQHGSCLFGIHERMGAMCVVLANRWPSRVIQVKRCSFYRHNTSAYSTCDPYLSFHCPSVLFMHDISSLVTILEEPGWLRQES
jgi:hypothetical protein